MDSRHSAALEQPLRAACAGLSQAEKRIAEAVLQGPEKAISANVLALARLSCASDANATRLCNRLGYSGHYPMQLYLARDLGRAQSGPAAGGADSPEAFLRQTAQGLALLGGTIAQERMLACARLMRQSSCVHLVTAGNTSPLALYPGFRLQRLCLRCSYNLTAEYARKHINLAQRHGDGHLPVRRIPPGHLGPRDGENARLKNRRH